MLSLGYLIELLTNFIFVVLIGFGFWYFKLWTTGDGKLFIAFAALLPLSVYNIGYQKFIPSVVLLINIYIPALIIMLFLMLFKSNLKMVGNVVLDFFKEFFQPKQLLVSVVNLFAIFWIIQLLLSFIGLNDYLVRVALTLVVFSFIQSKFKDKSFYVSVFVSLIRLLVDKSVYSIDFAINFLIIVLIWKVIRSFLSGSISKLGSEIFSKTVNTNRLKLGMVLGQNIKEIDVEPEGLTKEQIQGIKKLGLKNVKISQTIPFAPFIFLGVLLTLIFKGNVLIVLMNLLY